MSGYRITSGRIIDLSSVPDAVDRDVIVCDGLISERPQGDEKVLDATECIVVPGFVDVHVHLAPAWGGRFGLDMAVCAGVTFALDVTGPSGDVRELLRASRVRLGVSVCEAVRMDTIGRSLRGARTAVGAALDSGACGIKILGGHSPLTPSAMRNVIAACAERKCLCVIHVGSTRQYSDVGGLRETLALADGMPVHIAHVNGYCRGYHGSPVKEAAISLDLLRKNPNATSDSYVFRWNALPLANENGRFTSHAIAFWLRRLGYSSNLAGVWSLWADGRGQLVVVDRDRQRLLAYRDAGTDPRHWLTQAMYLSLPVNPVEAAIALAGARDPNGGIPTIQCLSTDGGGIPRNVMVPVAWHLVQLGVWSWRDAITKTSAEPARIIGLRRRGVIEPEEVADLTVIEGCSGKVVGSIVHGELAFWRGRFIELLYLRTRSSSPCKSLRLRQLTYLWRAAGEVRVCPSVERS